MGKGGKKKEKKEKKKGKKRHFFRHIKGHSLRTLLDFRPLHLAYGSVTIGASNPEGCEPGLDPSSSSPINLIYNLKFEISPNSF